MAEPSRIVLVRHGETEWSASGQHTSSTDLPLIEAGREQARALGPLLRAQEFRLVLSSPLRRALETCELTGFSSRVAACEDLKEWNYGEYEGLTTPQIRASAPDWKLWRDGCPGGESPEQIGARVDRVLRLIDEGDGDEGDGDVLLFGHGHCLRVLAACWIEQPVAFGARLALSAGAVSVLGYERETRVVARWSEVPGRFV